MDFFIFYYCMQSNLPPTRVSVPDANLELLLYSSLVHWPHCPKNNLNLRIKIKPVTAGADAMVGYIKFLLTYVYICPRNKTYTVASAPAVTGWVFMRRSRLFLDTNLSYNTLSDLQEAGRNEPAVELPQSQEHGDQVNILFVVTKNSFFY